MRKIIMYSISILLNLCAIIGIIITSIIFKFDHRFFQIYLGISILMAVINSIYIMLLEIFIKEYKYNKFSFFMHATYAIINTCAYYIFKHFNTLSLDKDTLKFDNYYANRSTYLIVTIGLTIVSIIVFNILKLIKFKEKEIEFDPKKYQESKYNPEDYLDKKYGLKDEDDSHRLFKKKK